MTYVLNKPYIYLEILMYILVKLVGALLRDSIDPGWNLNKRIFKYYQHYLILLLIKFATDWVDDYDYDDNYDYN